MRRAFAILSAFLPVIGAACVYSNEAPRAAAPSDHILIAPAPPAEPAFTRLTATLPEPASEGLPPTALDRLAEGVPVLLDLTLLAPLTPSLRQPDATFALAEGCDFGVVEAGAVSLPTGSHHMLIDADLGTRAGHPANLLSCEYDPSLMTQDRPGARWRLRGCFLPRLVSIPTASLWSLNPLPASACGIGN